MTGKEKTNSHKINWGRIFVFVVTFAWLGFILLLAVYGKTPTFELELYELGDFLAGSFAPLAFFWFVIGYFQQGKELQLQREELALQRKEFNFQGKQAERQADATEKQLALGERELEKGEKEIRPRLIYQLTQQGSNPQGMLCTINFKNIGGTAYRFKLQTTAANLSEIQFPNIEVMTNQQSNIKFVIPSTEQLPQPIELTYFDLEQNEYLHIGLIGIDEKTNREFFDNQKLIGKR